jgi:death-on-curing protein
VEDIIFLSVDDVLLIHTDTIDNDGGSHGVRDHGLLDAAVAMPRQQFGGEYLHEDLPAMAAAYMFHIAQNHPFVDGNKRAAVLSALVFLNMNGVRELPDPKELESITLQVAASELGKDALIKWIRKNVGKKK